MRTPMRRWIMAVLLLGGLLLMTHTALAETLDLRGRSFENLDALTAVLDAAQAPEVVDLTDVPLTTAERKTLLARYPQTHFRWTMTLWGVTVSSEDEEVNFEGKEWMNIDELCALLDTMPNLQTVNMWDKRMKKKDLNVLLGYPDINFGMTIRMNESHVVRTDWTAYSTLGRQPYINRFDVAYFAFLKNLKALDVGHMFTKTLDYVATLNKLKILIVADCSVSDLTPLASQTELEYLELFKNPITDISQLATLTNLRDLNIGYCQITDLSPLYDLPNLERVWLMGNWKLPEEEIERLREHQPDCEIVSYSYGATGNQMNASKKQIPGTSWRHHKHYDTIHWIFHHHEYIDWDVEVPQVKTVNDP
ncbi:MAG: leucine-rich repeat domain-containing protein [Aristaeellaceae bacterium]